MQRTSTWMARMLAAVVLLAAPVSTAVAADGDFAFDLATSNYLSVNLSGYDPHSPIPNPPAVASFIQIGSNTHPILGTSLSSFFDFAGRRIGRGSENDRLRFRLGYINNGGGTASALVAVTFEFIDPYAGPGVTGGFPGLEIVPTPQPPGVSYPIRPYPVDTQFGNIIGWYDLYSTGGGTGDTGNSTPTFSNPVSMGPGGSASFSLGIRPVFPGAWRLRMIATDINGVLPTQSWDVGGIAEPAPTASPVVRSLATLEFIRQDGEGRGLFGQTVDPAGATPLSPSITTRTYRIYNVGAQPLTIANFSSTSLQGGVLVSVLRVLDQNGDVIPPDPGKTVALPHVLRAYDGIATPQGNGIGVPGPHYAYGGGSSPVGPYVDVVLGLRPTQTGNFRVRINAGLSGSVGGFTWEITGSGFNAPEIEQLYGTTLIESGETIFYTGSQVNHVPGKGPQYTTIIRNIGTANLNLGVPTFLSVDGSATGQLLPGGSWDGAAPVVVAPNASVTLNFRIWPTIGAMAPGGPPDSGGYQIDLRIPNNDFDENPSITSFVGNATQRLPRLTVERNGRSIPNNGVDIESTVTSTATSVLTYTLRNTGDRELSIANPIAINGPVATSVATITGDLTPITLDPVDPVTLALPPGGTVDFNLNVQALNALDSFRVPIRITSNTGSIDSGAANVHAFIVTDYKSDGGEGRECGFGSPFGLLLLIGGLLLWRRRLAA